MVQRRDDKRLRQAAEKLRELRKARGLTQAAVYEDTGLHIGKMEAEKNNLTLTTIAILCDYFEITLKEFFDGIE